MEAMARARDATRLEPLCTFFFLCFIIFYYANDISSYAHHLDMLQQGRGAGCHQPKKNSVNDGSYHHSGAQDTSHVSGKFFSFFSLDTNKIF